MSKTTRRTTKNPQENVSDRETKILNVISNTSILMMAMLTEIFSDTFSKLAAEMVQVVTTSLASTEEETKERRETMNGLTTELPKQMIKQVSELKADFTTQLKERKEEIGKMIVNPVFDQGIAIAEQYDFGIPRLTQELDERSILQYIALLKGNHPECITMVQHLIEWMNNLPKPTVT